MWFSLALLILLLAIAFYQSTLGLFSTLIMLVLTICCAAVAFGTYEWVAVNWIAPKWQPDCAAAIALVATFAVPLLVLRVLADKLIRRSSLLPSWLDRIGGGVCGLVTAMILVGVMAVGLQMVPFDNGSILGYSRVAVHPLEKKDDGPNPTPPDPDAKESDLLLKPDRFAAAVASFLSDGIFSDRRSFAADNPDLVKATGWLNAAPRGVSRYAPAKSIRFVKTEPVGVVYKYSPPQPNKPNEQGSYDLIHPKGSRVFQMIRVQLTRDAMGPNKSHAFTLRQFRLVGHLPGIEQSQQYYPIAIQQEKDERPNRHIKLMRNRQYGFWPVTERAMEPREGNNAQVEVVFELPDNFKPAYLEYKRAARMHVSFDSGDSGRQARKKREPPPSAASRESEDRPSDTTVASSQSPSSEKASDSQRGGKIRRFASKEGKSRFSDQMPIALRAYLKLKNAETRRGALVDGHLVGFVDEQESGHHREISRFKVPSDKRLLQLNTKFLEARSGLGKAISSVVKTVQNYFVEDTRGRQYKVLGKYAIASVNGRRVIEVQYFSGPVGMMGGLGPFDRIKEDRDLKGDYEFVLLFLVDPGARIKRFSTGGSATRAEDLTTENLIAPE